MNHLLLSCPHCGTIYKIVKTDRENECLLTDFGDCFKIDMATASTGCIKCNNSIQIIDNSMVTDDWVAELVFTIKGK